MSYFILASLFGLMLGLVVVASNLSPYFAALGLVVAAGAGCGVLAGHGGSFLSLVLFLIYLGGMLVVFAYSAALAAEPYPETLGNWPVVGRVVGAVVVVAVIFFSGGWEGLVVAVEAPWYNAELMGGSMGGDMAGMAMLYFLGGPMLGASAWMLLLCLFAVLELTRGLGRGSLRAV